MNRIAHSLGFAALLVLAAVAGAFAQRSAAPLPLLVDIQQTIPFTLTLTLDGRVVEVPAAADIGLVIQIRPAGHLSPTVVIGESAPAVVTISTPSAPPVSDRSGELGIRQESGGIAVTVMSMRTENNIGGFFTPDPGNVYLVVEVLIENTDRDEAPYNPLYFTLKDGDGFEYNASFTAPAPDLKSGKLMKGERVRGNVAFEVAPSVSELVLSFEPIVLFGDYKPIRIKLPDPE
jgi:hypothetical protein